MTDLRPAPGAAAELSDALEFTVRGGEVESRAVTVEVDRADVTAECDIRTPMLHPPNRADFSFRPPGGWAPGPHVVRVRWAEAGLDESWEFEVA